MQWMELILKTQPEDLNRLCGLLDEDGSAEDLSPFAELFAEAAAYADPEDADDEGDDADKARGQPDVDLEEREGYAD